MIVPSHRGGFSVSCSRACGEGLVLGAKTWELAREAVLAEGWQENRRRGGIKKSAWTCPACAAVKKESEQAYIADTTTGYRLAR